jgi:hypothetical protein
MPPLVLNASLLSSSAATGSPSKRAGESLLGAPDLLQRNFVRASHLAFATALRSKGASAALAIREAALLAQATYCDGVALVSSDRTDCCLAAVEMVRRVRFDVLAIARVQVRRLRDRSQVFPVCPPADR